MRQTLHHTRMLFVTFDGLFSLSFNIFTFFLFISPSDILFCCCCCWCACLICVSSLFSWLYSFQYFFFFGMFCVLAFFLRVCCVLYMQFKTNDKNKRFKNIQNRGNIPQLYAIQIKDIQSLGKYDVYVFLCALRYYLSTVCIFLETNTILYAICIHSLYFNTYI